jgi:trk system potassium uptake protein TrkH
MAEHAVHALVHAARVRVVAGTLAQLLITLGLLTVVPAALALGMDSEPLGLRLAVTAIALVAAGWLLMRQPGLDLARIDLQWNEALAVTALAFTLAGTAMVWPLTASGLGVLDALFEAVSGVTTTGLTVLRNADEADPALLFLRAWMQWYGGLGIAVLTAALVMRHHASARRLLETTGERLTSAGARQHARTVFLVYAAITVIAIAAVSLAGVAPFDAMLYALSAAGTGGFAPSDQSLAPLPGPAIAVLSIVTLLTAVTLPLYAQVPRHGLRVLWQDVEARALFVLAAAVALSITVIVLLHQRLSLPEALGHGLALGISAQTDTGFSTFDVGGLAPAALVVLMLAMTIGGCTGSTAGGLKLIRVLLITKLVQLALRRTAIAERAVLHARLEGETVQPDMVTSTLQLLSLWLAVLLLSWLIFLLHGAPPLQSLFEVVSATANAGLSTGLTGSDLPAMLKVVLIVDMLFGRVEILALLVLLYPTTWIGRRRKL